MSSGVSYTHSLLFKYFVLLLISLQKDDDSRWISIYTGFFPSVYHHLYEYTYLTALRGRNWNKKLHFSQDFEIREHFFNKTD